VDSKAECDELNLANVARKKVYNETKANASAHLIRYRLRSIQAVQKEPERLWRKGFVKEIEFLSLEVEGVMDGESEGKCVSYREEPEFEPQLFKG